MSAIDTPTIVAMARIRIDRTVVNREDLKRQLEMLNNLYEASEQVAVRRLL
jgi:hypothetical protein